jgi:hypothetical protein
MPDIGLFIGLLGNYPRMNADEENRDAAAHLRKSASSADFAASCPSDFGLTRASLDPASVQPFIPVHPVHPVLSRKPTVLGQGSQPGAR